MKFFKYLIFTIFVFLSVNAYSKTVLQEYSSYGSFDSESAACAYLASKSSAGSTYKIETSSPNNRCTVYNSGGTYQLGAWLITTKDECSASSVSSKPISVPGWQNWNPDQTIAYQAKVQNQTACYKGCKYKNPILTAGNTSDQMNLNFANPVKDSSCPATQTEAPDTPYPDNVTPPTDGCKSGEAYCDKPPTGCPSGYTSGSFNGKQICVKNNPDPTKPNPNDPNNNLNNSKFDDSKIIAAINDSKTAITNSINNAVNSINSSISSINQSITTVANAVNGTTNAVNNNTAATNAVKASVDALHNTINAVTTAVNNNTSAVTSAVNANTSATNAVKASVDALNSTVSAVTTAVDNNTKAVNANGDKVANAVKDNITATNAVKDAVSNLNSAVNAVSDAVNVNGKNAVDSINANGKNTVDAINSNGKNTVDAVNKGTEATKDNGKKLDGINDSVKEGNGHLKDIKDYLKEGKDAQFPEDGNTKVDIKTVDVGNFSENIFGTSAQCPANKTLSMNFLGRRAFSYTFDFSQWCYYLGLIGNFILICAYIYASNIVLRS